MNLAEKNPVVTRAAITAAVTAMIHTAVAFGLVDADQETAIGGMIDAAGLLVLVLWARAGVTPNAKVVAAVTAEGEVVAGDASVTPTGDPLPVIEPGLGNTGAVPVLGLVPIKPHLVEP